MKKRTIVLFVAAAATITSLMAQTQAKRTALTPEQKEQMQELRQKHAPIIKAIKDDIRLNKVEQKTLLASQEIDEKAIYANIDALGELKANLHKATTDQRNEIKEICPNANKAMAYRHRQHRPMQGQGYQQGNNRRQNNNGLNNGQGKRPNRQGMQQGQRPQKQHMQNQNGQRGNGNKKANINKRQGRNNSQGRHQNAYKQGRHNQHMMFGTNCKLTDEQKTAIAKVKKEHFWNIQETQNEIALLKASNTTPEKRQAAYNEVNALQTKLAKERMALKLDIMSQLTEEQRMLMISKMKQRNLKAKQHRSPRRA